MSPGLRCHDVLLFVCDDDQDSPEVTQHDSHLVRTHSVVALGRLQLSEPSKYPSMFGYSSNPDHTSSSLRRWRQWQRKALGSSFLKIPKHHYPASLSSHYRLCNVCEYDLRSNLEGDRISLIKVINIATIELEGVNLTPNSLLDTTRSPSYVALAFVRAGADTK